MMGHCNDYSIKKAAIINMLAKYVNVIISLLFTGLLARLLSPRDYGIVAIIMVFTTFFSLFADFGIGTGIIQNKELTKFDVDHIFSLTVYSSIFLGLLFYAMSFVMTICYNNNVFREMGIWLGLSIGISALNMVPNSILMKEKQFLWIGIRTVVSNIIGGIFAVCFAYKGFGPVSIVIQSIINNMIVFIWNCYKTRPIFYLNINLTPIKKISEYSGYQFLFSFVNYFARNADNLILSFVLGERTLGFYDKAYKLTTFPVTHFSHGIMPVLHPILSEYQDNNIYIYEQYVKVLKVISIVASYIVLICFFNSKELILLLFGCQWTDSIFCFKILCLSIWAQMLCTTSGTIFQSVGNTRMMFMLGCITSLLRIVLIVVGVIQRDINVLSICVTVAFNLDFYIVFYVLIKKLFRYDLYSFVSNFNLDIVNIVLIGAFMFWFNQFCLEPMNIKGIIMPLAIKVGIITIAFITSLYFEKRHKIILNLIKL